MWFPRGAPFLLEHTSPGDYLASHPSYAYEHGISMLSGLTVNVSSDISKTESHVLGEKNGTRIATTKNQALHCPTHGPFEGLIGDSLSFSA